MQFFLCAKADPFSREENSGKAATYTAAMFLHIIWVFLFFWLLIVSSGYAKTLVLHPDHSCESLGQYIEFLEDPSGQLTFSDVRSPDMGKLFSPANMHEFEHGITDATVWVRFAFVEPEPVKAEHNWLLHIHRNLFSYLKIYIPVKSEEGGIRWEVYEKGYETTGKFGAHIVQQIPSGMKEKAWVYMSLRTQGYIWMPADLCSGDSSITFFHWRMLGNGLYYGIIFVTSLMSLLMFLALRDRSYLWYVFFHAALVLYFLIANGLIFQLIPIPSYHNFGIDFFIAISMIVFWSGVFTRSFLMTSKNTPRLDKYVIAYSVMGLGLLPMIFIHDSPFVQFYSRLLGVGAPFVTIIPGFICYRNGFRPARFFLLGWTVYSISAFILAIGDIFNINGSVVFQIGSAFEALILAVALVDRMRILNQEQGILARAKESAERSLEKSEARFRTLTESTTAMIFIVNLEGKILYANPAAQEGTGYSWDELKVMSSFELMDDESKKKLSLVVADMKQGKPEPYKFEVKYIAKDGSEKWMEMKGGLIEFENSPARISTSFDITERKIAEENLREREEENRALLNAIPDLIFQFDQEGTFLSYKVPGEGNLLIPPGDFLGKKLVETMPKPLAEQTLKYIKAALETGETQFYEYTLPSFEGDPGEFEARIVRLSENRVLSIVRNITDRKLAEQRLTKAEQSFKTFVETTRAIVFVSDDEHDLLFANQAALDLTGYTFDEMKELPRKDFFSPTSISLMEELEETSIRGGELPTLFEVEIVTKSGELRRIEFTHGSMETNDGHVFYTTGFDITDRRKAEKALLESENRYRTIFVTTGTATIMFNDDAVISLANEEWSKLFGYSREEIEGKMVWMDFVDSSSLEKMSRYHQMRTNDPQSVPNTYEMKAVDRQGNVHEGILNINLVPGTHQRVASFQDLTDRKQAELQMFQADKMAALGQIIAGVAHEINNPNNFITFNLPILKRYVDAVRPVLDEKAEHVPDLKFLNMPYEMFLEDVFKLIENMQHGSERITSIVSELKTYIRNPDAEEQKPGHLGSVIDQVMVLVGKQVRKMVKQLKVDVVEDLPLVKMNPGQLEQVLINLLINAGQAADKEEAYVHLSAQVSSGKKEAVEIRVADNGSGIPETSLQKIFDPFYTTKGRETGTGLGLAISQRIIDKHGGSISVESQVGEGTVFTVSLPVYQEEKE